MTSKVEQQQWNKYKQSRLDFSIEKIKEYRNKERMGTVSIPLEESLSIEEMVCIEDSYFEVHEEIECESGCYECPRYCSNQCVRFLIHGSLGDDWSEGVNSIDDCLEDKRDSNVGHRY